MSFRYHCYKEFGWTPDVVRQIPLSEAHVLGMMFEEISAYEYKENQRMKRESASHSPDGYETEMYFSDDDEESAVYMDFEIEGEE